MKSEFFTEPVSKKEAADILLKYHYLKDISKTFRSGYNLGLFKGNPDDVFIGDPCGVCIFTSLPVPEIAVGAFGLDRDDQDGLFELSRLCLHPIEQSEEHNLAGWFVVRAIKWLQSVTAVRAIISYADSSFHAGTVYRATNWTYCGLTAPKFDYVDGDQIQSRGKSKSGDTRDRTQKHRFVKVFDKSLTLLWKP